MEARSSAPPARGRRPQPCCVSVSTSGTRPSPRLHLQPARFRKSINMKLPNLLQPTMTRTRRIQLLALPSQERFLRCQTAKKGFSGPAGAGKSYALCYQTLLSAERNPNCTGLIGAPTYQMLRDVTLKDDARNPGRKAYQVRLPQE